MPLSAGKRLGPYEIVAPVGAGGMGEVYRARDTRLNRDVAIKVLPDHLAQDPQALARFQREAMAVGALAHPNILVLHDVGADQEVHYAVTELLEGETLRERIGRGPMAWRKAAELGSAMAEGLAAAHSKGIVHQDIKPANIFLTSDGRVKILDFGLAQMRSAPAESENTATLTEAGPLIMGTVAYMAPEQVRGEKATPAGDLFSLGCVLYEMVTGRRAFSGKSATEIMASVLKDEPVPVAGSGNAISAELNLVIERCLAKDPAQRFHSAHDLAFALRNLSSSEYRVPALAPVRTRWPRVVLALAVLAALLAFAAFYVLHGNASRNIDSLAVLPFVNGGGGEDTDWLSDGITESLIGSLAQVPGLKVMSRNAAFRYKGKDIDAKDVASKLGVRAVLTGRIVERKDQLSVSTELIDASDGSVLWGDKYDRPMADILAVQQEITGSIAEKLRRKLAGGEKQKVSSQGTANPEAYQLYLKGKYFSAKFTKEGFDKGMEYFRQAIAVDPNYARAYEGIAYAYTIAEDAFVAPLDAMPKAREAARKAVELDDSLSLGHTQLGAVFLWFDYDWRGGEREFRRAIELNPNDALAHEIYGWLLAAKGDVSNGIAEGRRSLEADPLSTEAATVLAGDYYLARRYGEALDVLRKGIEQDPGYPLAYYLEGWVYLVQGHAKEAVAALEKGQEVGPLDWTAELLAAAYAADGNRAGALKILSELDARAKRGGYVSAYYQAFAYLALGDRNKALDLLEKDYEQRGPYFTYLKMDPGLDSLRKEPRFIALLKKLKLEDAGK